MCSSRRRARSRLEPRAATLHATASRGARELARRAQGANARSHQRSILPQRVFDLDAFASVECRHACRHDAAAADSSAGSTPTLPRTPNSPSSIVKHTERAAEVVTSASATRAAASPSACGPGGHRCATRSLDTRELDLRQHALERVTANRCFAPGDDEAAGRRAKYRQPDLGRRALRLDAPPSTSPQPPALPGAEPIRRSRRMCISCAAANSRSRLR